jgi:hypothetical protein
MDYVELFPTLSRCIETAARDEFRDAVAKYMKGARRDEELEQRIQFVRAFLQSADFGKLRSESEIHLMQGRKVKFVLRWKDGKLSYRMVFT